MPSIMFKLISIKDGIRHFEKEAPTFRDLINLVESYISILI